MKITTISSREFNQDVSRAKRAADNGPVIITNRGQPAYLLLRHETYKHLAGGRPDILELPGMPVEKTSSSILLTWAAAFFARPTCSDVPAGHQRPVRAAESSQGGSKSSGIGPRY